MLWAVIQRPMNHIMQYMLTQENGLWKIGLIT